ncbi:MAG: sensor histidine kinase, partial [Spirochaetes bacterium]|nr:sensor histidine kinase [Spirochaetota bacterium]
LSRDYSNVFVLNIKDNGPGISAKINVLNTNSMGLNIINTLVNQISGKLVYKYNNGADFNIIFSYNEEKSAISDQSI